jgi:predicted DCC family thiol-disulfide oxidoreductase YuxK
LRNPGQAAAFAILAAAGVGTPWAWVAAAAFFCACEIEAGIRRREGPRWWPSAWPQDPGAIVILYDATCGLCARSKAHLETWPTARGMRFVPLQSQEARSLAPNLSESELLGAMHVVEEGRVYSAHEGWFRIMRRGPIWAAAFARLVPRGLARPAYAWVARHRYRWFGRACEAGACAVHLPRRP